MAARAKTLGKENDLAKLPELNARIILEELEARYKKDVIYTNVGDILIALNPFKELGIYSRNVANQYKIGAQLSGTPPHIFAVAQSAYQSMLGVGSSKPQNQCCVISGESGAGKTESAKFLIGQLVELSKGTSQLEQQILQVNPLLEAFGNARTLMNNNSSRFGKYIQLKFDGGSVIGAKISEYLLEKSRVVQQNHGEQNFHIFYYLFAGLSSEELAKYSLMRPEKYRYLLTSTSGFRSGKTNHALFQGVVNAMDLVGFLDEEQQDMFTILSCVLNLGNICFDADEQDGAVIRDAHGALRLVAKLIGVEPDKVADALTTTTSVTRGSVIKRRFKEHQAADVRDAVAKALYGRLFSWIVNKINQLLAPPVTARGEHITEIGILDIFGFEHFEHNSFEQSCINLANEQLQFFFNQHIFMWEQEEYKREGIDWSSVTYADNKPVLDLFLSKPIGILALLDEESHFPQSTDHSFVEKLNKNFEGNKFFIKARHAQSNNFTIVHYAGKVDYETTGFLEKNRDTLPTGFMDLLKKSNNELVSKIFTGTLTRTGTLALQGRISKGNMVRRTKRLSQGRQNMNKGAKKLTLGAQFKNSLSVLMERMTAASPHFIRCIKPNVHKEPDYFDEKYVSDQLRYTGVLETTRIRREGYAVRMPFEDFVEKYKLLVYTVSLPYTMQSCKRILSKSNLTDWQIGKTKVFLKYYHVEQLMKRLDAVLESVVKMQKVVRGFLARRRFKRMQTAARVLKKQISIFLAEVENSKHKLYQRLNGMIKDDTSHKSEILSTATGKYSALDFPPVLPAKKDVYFPSPPPEAYDHKVFGTLDEVEIDDEELLDDFDTEEDTFVRRQDKYAGAATREAAVQWFQETQAPKGAVQDASGMMQEWFHGIITRRLRVGRNIRSLCSEKVVGPGWLPYLGKIVAAIKSLYERSEELLSDKVIGCFLIRVSESRFGYTLSYKAITRCKHWMIDQTRSGKYVIVGMPMVYKTLRHLVEFHQKNPINEQGDILTEPCGQENEEAADYIELVEVLPSAGRESLPPPLPDRNYSAQRPRVR